MDKEKLLYLLSFFDEDMEIFIYEVLNDSKEDPHFSAVSATNRIKCYIQILSELGEELPYSNVREYMLFNAFTEDEYNAFEKRRKEESEYYIGVQY